MSATDISKELDEMFREYFLEVMRGAVEQDGETIAVFAERTKKIRQKFIASTEALIDRAVTEARIDGIDKIHTQLKLAYISDDEFTADLEREVTALKDYLSNTTGEGK